MKSKFHKIVIWALALGVSTLPFTAQAQQAAPAKVFHVDDEDKSETEYSFFEEIFCGEDDKPGFDKAVAENPQSEAALSNRGAYYLYHGEFQNAVIDIQKSIALAPKDPFKYFSLGRALRGLNRTEEAVAAFMKVHEVDAESPVPLYAIGLTYLQAKQYNKAIENFTQKIALEKENSSAYVKRGQAYFEQTKYSEALSDLNKAIEMHKKADPLDFYDWPHHNFGSLAQAYFYRSLIGARHLDLLSKDDKLAPVIADAKKAVEHDVMLAEEYSRRAAPMLLDVNQKYGALALLSGAAAAQPKNTGVLLQLADAQHKTFHSEDAIKTYTAVLALKPDEPTTLVALRGRAATYIDSSTPYDAKQWQLAIDDLSRAAFADSKDAATLLSLTNAYYNAGKNEEGLSVINVLLKDQPHHAHAHMLHALGLALTGNKDDALIEAKISLPLLADAGSEEAQSAIGNASGHYPKNAVLVELLKLFPEKEDDENDVPYFL